MAKMRLRENFNRPNVFSLSITIPCTNLISFPPYAFTMSSAYSKFPKVFPCLE